MRLTDTEHTSRPWRIHELTADAGDRAGLADARRVSARSSIGSLLAAGRVLRPAGGGVLRLPDGPPPEFGLYLLGDRPGRSALAGSVGPLAGLPAAADREDAQDAIREGWRRTELERVEIAWGSTNGSSIRVAKRKIVQDDARGGA